MHLLCFVFVFYFLRAGPELWVLQECWCQASLHLRISYTSCECFSAESFCHVCSPLTCVLSVPTPRPSWSPQRGSWLSMRSTTGLHESLPISGETQPHGRYRRSIYRDLALKNSPIFFIQNKQILQCYLTCDGKTQRPNSSIDIQN